MTPSDSAVRNLSESDIDSVAALLARSFDDDAAYRFLFPFARGREAGLTDFFARNLRAHLPYRCTYILSGDDGCVLGTVTLRPPGEANYDELEHEMIGTVPHWLVHMMAVRPGSQGSGLGTRLLSSLLPATHGTPVVLTTHTERNVAFYRRLGFDVTDVRSLAPPRVTEEYTVWCMHRFTEKSASPSASAN